MNVTIRVDASPVIGTGHLARCLTLAGALRQHGASIRFVAREMPAHLRRKLQDEGHELVLIRDTGSSSPGDLVHSHWLAGGQASDALETGRLLSDRSWDWLVVDHYALDARWETAMREHAERIFVLDDLADRAHDCEVLLDQNFYLNAETRYQGRVHERTQLLLGPRYALLRGEFSAARASATARNGSVRRVLVFVGGMDPENHTARVVEALSGLAYAGLAVDVVIGQAHPDRDGIQQLCTGLGFSCHVQTDRMAELMAAADLAIGAGGATTWERCCVGLPALVLIVADNQRRLVEDGVSQGFLYAPAFSQGCAAEEIRLHCRALLQNPGLLRMLSRKALETVDGRGVRRVLRALGLGQVTVRAATHGDSKNIYEWRNDVSVRRASRNREPIPWSAHEQWLSATLADPARSLLVGECNGAPAGVVRFDVSRQEAEVSIYLAPGRAGQGLGLDLLLSAESWLANSGRDLQRLTAEVVGENEPSHRLFRAAGYELVTTRYTKRLDVNE